MPPPNPAEKLRDAPVADLVVVLLKQFKRLLAEHNIEMTTEQMTQIGDAAAKQQPSSPQIQAIITAIDTLVQESMNELQTRFGLSFAASLAADMNSIGGWETTSDFLEIANHKSNAELRISSGGALLAFLGDTRYAEALFTVIQVDAGANDVDAMFAQRSLAHATRIDLEADDWEARVRHAIATQDETH